MDDAAFEDALRRILASSSSAEEVRQRLRDELGYPYIIAITMEPLGEPWGGFQYAVMANGPSGEIINITH